MHSIYNLNEANSAMVCHGLFFSLCEQEVKRGVAAKETGFCVFRCHSKQQLTSWV